MAGWWCSLALHFSIAARWGSDYVAPGTQKKRGTPLHAETIVSHSVITAQRVLHKGTSSERGLRLCLQTLLRALSRPDPIREAPPRATAASSAWSCSDCPGRRIRRTITPIGDDSPDRAELDEEVQREPDASQVADAENSHRHVSRVLVGSAPRCEALPLPLSRTPRQ